jgi:GNAT superfamily N-acetyltransferase|tara:strand:- start:39 stop:893 length:855 start_codon:yes stop_codon:yes gene_type:complete
MIKVRELQESELEFAKSLTDGEEWGNSIEDWQRLLRISIPLVAYEGDELLGVTTAFDYGNLGMIGNVVVSSKSRGKGVGKALLKKAMKKLETCKSVRVHSRMDVTSFYKDLGFMAEGMSTVFRLDANMKSFQPFDVESDKNNIVSAESYWDEIIAMDLRQFGADRSRFLKELNDYLPQCSFVALGEDGSVKGFIMAKGEDDWYEIGPWIVEPGCKNWQGLLQATAQAIPDDSTVEIFVPAPNFRVTSLLDSVEYNAHSYCMSMYYGEDWPDEGNICARGGGDKG